MTESQPNTALNASPELSKRAVLERIRDLGVAPKTVFDLGIATGTPGLYGVFPDVRYVMIEPLKESERFMRQLAETYPGSIAVHAAAGREAGEKTFIVHAGLSGSSFFLKPKFGEPRQVPVVTVDSLVEKHALEGPFLMKLDVQGFELEALAGSEQTLKNTVAVLTEASLWADVKGRGMATLIDLMNWFNDRGFVLYDIAQTVRREQDGAIAEMDLVFVPADSPLRKMIQFKTDEARAQTTDARRKKFGLI